MALLNLTVLRFRMISVSINDIACPRNQMLSLYVGLDINNFAHVNKVDGTFFLEVYLHYLPD